LRFWLFKTDRYLPWSGRNLPVSLHDFLRFNNGLLCKFISSEPVTNEVVRFRLARVRLKRGHRQRQLGRDPGHFVNDLVVAFTPLAQICVVKPGIIFCIKLFGAKVISLAL
jgi:hypothetical protein